MHLAAFTWVLLRSTPDAQERHWTYVRASDPDEALAQDPEAYHAFKLPTQRTRSFVLHLLRHGTLWLAGSGVASVLLAVSFRRSSAGFVVMSWTYAFGMAALLIATLFLITLTYLLVLDLVCMREGERRLSELAVAGDPGSTAAVIDAYGEERVKAAARRVRLGFGAAVLILVIAANLFR